MDNNIRLGDFGLATFRTSSNKSMESEVDVESESETSVVVDTSNDTSALVGASLRRQKHSLPYNSSHESLTGGVGTTFYRSPEQEGHRAEQNKDYNFAVDIYALGVTTFEIFSPPFSTLMERAKTLTRLRAQGNQDMKVGGSSNAWKEAAKEKFSEDFRNSAPENAQRLILWCLEDSPQDRPSAQKLLQR